MNFQILRLFTAAINRNMKLKEKVMFAELLLFLRGPLGGCGVLSDSVSTVCLCTRASCHCAIPIPSRNAAILADKAHPCPLTYPTRKRVGVHKKDELHTLISFQGCSTGQPTDSSTGDFGQRTDVGGGKLL